MSFEVSIQDLAKNARAAYEAKALQAQTKAGTPDSALRFSALRKYPKCSYVHNCSIGASIPTAVAAEFDNQDLTVDALIKTKKLVVTGLPNSNRAAEILLSNLQSRHDSWVGADEKYAPGHEAHFVEALVDLETFVKNLEND